MKPAVLLLLLANLALGGWIYTHQDFYSPRSNAAIAQLAAPVEPLILLRERGEPGAVADDAVARPAQANPPPAMPDVRSLEMPASGPDTVQVAAPPIPGIDGTPSVKDAAEASVLETADSQPLPSHDSMDPGFPLPEAAETVTPVRICQTIGPFQDRATADKLADELTAAGRAPAVRTSSIEQPSGYWVYLPSMSRAEARRIIDDLSSKGVRDYFLGRQNFISLGVFSDKVTADERVREIAALGYQPDLEPRFLTREVFWVDIAELASDLLDDAQWQSLVGQQPGVRRQPVACE